MVKTLCLSQVFFDPTEASYPWISAQCQWRAGKEDENSLEGERVDLVFIFFVFFKLQFYSLCGLLSLLLRMLVTCILLLSNQNSLVEIYLELYFQIISFLCPWFISLHPLLYVISASASIMASYFYFKEVMFSVTYKKRCSSFIKF